MCAWQAGARGHIDSNGDGVITNEEFKELYKQMDKSDGLSPVLRDSFHKTVNTSVCERRLGSSKSSWNHASPISRPNFR